MQGSGEKPDRPGVRYGWSVALTALAVAACFALQSVVDETILYPVSVAVGTAAVLLGAGPAALATLLGGAGTLPIVLSGRNGDIARWLVLNVADALLVVLGTRLEATRTRERRLAAELEAERRRFGIAQEVSPHGFAMLDPIRDAAGGLVDLRFRYANPAGGRLLGEEPGRIVGRRMTELLPTSHERLPAYERVLRTGTPFSVEVRQLVAGRPRLFELTCVRVDGGLAVSFRDVTARHRAEERDRMLADIAVVMDHEPEIAPRARALADLLADRIADAVRVDVVRPTGELAFGAVAADDPRAAELLRSLPVPRRGEPLDRAIRAGGVRRLEHLDGERLADLLTDRPARAAIRELGAGSALLLPLVARGRAVGAVLALRRAARPPFDAGDEALLRLLSGRAALALDNARLFEQQRGIAHTLQASLLPDALPLVPGLTLAARYRAAGEGLEVGGDFYDVLPGPAGGGPWTAVVGDVVGKGAEAAAVTSLVRHTLRLGAPGSSPAAALRRVNGAVRAEGRPGLFCTATAVELTVCDDGSVALCSASAGHPSPLVVRRDGSVEAIDCDGMLLGWMEDVALGECPGRLGPGDAVVLYTDGVVEARRDRDFFGEQRLHELLHRCAGRPPGHIADAVQEAAVVHAGRRPPDDIAILVASATPVVARVTPA